MERRIFFCDLCGVQQETTNHWFTVGITWGTESNGGATLTLAKLESLHSILADELLHLCGERCVTRKVNEFLSNTLAEILTSEAKEAAHSIPAEGTN